MKNVAVFVKKNYEFVVLISVFSALMFVFAFAYFILPQFGIVDSIPLNTVQIDYNLLYSLPVYM